VSGIGVVSVIRTLFTSGLRSKPEPRASPQARGSSIVDSMAAADQTSCRYQSVASVGYGAIGKSTTLQRRGIWSVRAPASGPEVNPVSAKNDPA